MNVLPKTETTSGGRENFVSRLYQMLSTPKFAGIVSWNETDQGPSFVILDTAKFQEYVSVNEFNHANFSSFVRQLNKYDFHKVKFRDAHSRVWEFRHPNFRPENRDKPYLIKRKQQSSGRRTKRGDSLLREQADVAAKAAESAASNAEGIMHNQVTDLETRISRLEENSMQFLSALKMQQKLVERLLRAIDLPDDDLDDMHLPNLPQSTGITNNSGHDSKTDNPSSNNNHNVHNQQPNYNMPAQQAQTNMMVNQPAERNAQTNNDAHVSTHNGMMVSNGQQLSAQQMMNHMGTNMNGNDMNMNSRMAMEINSDYAHTPAISPGNMSAPSPGPGSPIVLMAVDNEKVRDVLCKLLLKFGCRVESVDNGIDVVQKVETHNYDFILIDCILKALDGVSAVELIRQSNKITPIILMSDQISNDEHETCLSRGVSAILYRPFNQNDLYSTSREYKLPQTMI